MEFRYIIIDDTYYESKIATSNTFLEKEIVFYFITGTRNI